MVSVFSLLIMLIHVVLIVSVFPCSGICDCVLHVLLCPYVVVCHGVTSLFKFEVY